MRSFASFCEVDRVGIKFVGEEESSRISIVKCFNFHRYSLLTRPISQLSILVFLEV